MKNEYNLLIDENNFDCNLIIIGLILIIKYTHRTKIQVDGINQQQLKLLLLRNHGIQIQM